jgi:hypothetical protein
MAKGKGGSGKTYTSKGERRSSIKTASDDPGQKMLNKQKAWLKGQNPWITIENPNREQTNKRFIRVRMNDTSLGNPKERAKKMFVIN